tara:strand:+ start:454 stop:621 length:168 start_codon:yes stop_codon:yes gene_type:complete
LEIEIINYLNEEIKKGLNANKAFKKTEKLQTGRGLSWLWFGRDNCKRISTGASEI